MFSPYIIVDNFFDNPYGVVELAKSQSYERSAVETGPAIAGLKIDRTKPVPSVSWRGYRSRVDDLVITRNYGQLLFDKLFPDVRVYQAGVGWCFSYMPEMARESSWFHKDSQPFLAGVIYLSHNPPSFSGTIVGEHTIENKFNRMVAYPANTTHSPSCGFGDTIDDARLTLNFFIFSMNMRSLMKKNNM